MAESSAVFHSAVHELPRRGPEARRLHIWRWTSQVHRGFLGCSAHALALAETQQKESPEGKGPPQPFGAPFLQ